MQFQKGNTFGAKNKGNKPNLGKHFSEEHKKKISVALSGRKHSEESRKKMSTASKGKKLSLETRKKMSLAHKGKPSRTLGKRWKIEDTSQRKGKNHYRWIQDRTKLKTHNDIAKDRRCSAYAEWRKRVWMRDNYTCKMANPDCTGKIEAHHILSFTKFADLRYDINNGITLCHFHHPRKRVDEINLSPYFKELVMNIK